MRRSSNTKKYGPQLTREEAGIILNKIFANRMKINRADKTLEIRFVSDHNKELDPEMLLCGRVLRLFGAENVSSRGLTNQKTMVIPLAELDMPVLAEYVNFPGSEEFRSPSTGRNI